MTLWCPDDADKVTRDRISFGTSNNQLQPYLRRDGTPFSFTVRGLYAGASRINVRLGSSADQGNLFVAGKAVMVKPPLGSAYARQDTDFDRWQLV